MPFYTYILASDRNGTLHVGSTDDLARRIYDAQEMARPGFTDRNSVARLVWFEAHDSQEAAKTQERRMKEWKRAWKLWVIEGDNPHWDDLAERLNDLLPFG